MPRKGVAIDGALVEGEDAGMRSCGGRKAADNKYICGLVARGILELGC